MKHFKTYRDKIGRIKLLNNISDSSIEGILEIKSVSQISHPKTSEIPKALENTQPFNDPTPSSPIKYNQIISYMKILEEENKKLQFDIFSIKEENSLLLRKNKELQIKNSSQQSYIMALRYKLLIRLR